MPIVNTLNYHKHSFFAGSGSACAACGEPAEHSSHHDVMIRDWEQAEKHLQEIRDNYLHQGSLGVTYFMQDVKPLLLRFNSGERSAHLWEEIFELKMWGEV
ncbi:MAG: hypothetical protein EPO24_15910 [Bacteroidetes bacterium]|nr:MAG: hypothetical protein EPO24_15910 [Bacteroidota bacterium]